MGGGDFAEGAANFGRAVQDEPPAQASRGAGVDLVEQRRAEEVGAVHGRDEMIVRGVERPLIVVVGVVEADLRPGPDAHVVAVVGVRLEPRQPGLVDDAGGVVDAEPETPQAQSSAVRAELRSSGVSVTPELHHRSGRERHFHDRVVTIQTVDDGARVNLR